jgi:hypothetical protein
VLPTDGRVVMCYEESANHDGTINKMTNCDQKKHATAVQRCRINVSFVDTIYCGNNVCVFDGML